MLASAKTAVALLALTMLASRPEAPRLLTVRLDGNRFIPAELRAAPGDTLRFVNGNGGPHNVEFIPDSIAPADRKLFEHVMPGGKYKLGPTSGPLLIDMDEAYVMVVPNVPAKRYAFICLPHQAQMRGGLVVTKH